MRPPGSALRTPGKRPTPTSLVARFAPTHKTLERSGTKIAARGKGAARWASQSVAVREAQRRREVHRQVR